MARVIREYDIEPKFSGLVIGKQGTGLRELKSIQGVINIWYDTKSSFIKHKLQVSAINAEVCEEVHNVVNRRIVKSKRSKNSGVTVPYSIDPEHTGIVLGKKGSTLSELKKMPGVISIFIDTKTSSEVHILTIRGDDEMVCEAVYAEVQKRVDFCVSAFPKVVKMFIDEEDRSCDTINLRLFGCDESVVHGDKNSRYLVISSFKKSSLADALENMNLKSNPGTSKSEPDYMELEEEDISKAFQEGLNNHKSSSEGVLDFHVSPGKVLFKGDPVSNLSRSKLTGKDSKTYFKQKGLRPFFTPNVNQNYIDILNKQLHKLNFENLNQDCAEKFTTVHLSVLKGTELTHFSVILAIDENLQQFKVAAQDPRLGKEKKAAIERIMDAKTIGEVLDFSASSAASLKQKYYKLTLSVHPDKNSHPGANEAFKKLGDAFEKLKSGKFRNFPALEVTMPPVEEEKIPPKVVKVRTNKIRLCVVTTLSDKKLDFRGTLVGFEDDKEQLTGVIRNVVNSCWEQRDDQGKIASEYHDIHVESIKQVLEMHKWIKEIPLNEKDEHGETAILEIGVKKLREKSRSDSIWQDCAEIDLKLEYERKTMTGEILAKEMLILKMWAERLLKNILNLDKL